MDAIKAKMLKEKSKTIQYYKNKPSKVIHRGETVEDFLARGGTIKRVEPGIAEYAVGFTTKWPGGRP